jgi:hypothetical protein
MHLDPAIATMVTPDPIKKTGHEDAARQNRDEGASLAGIEMIVAF